MLLILSVLCMLLQQILTSLFYRCFYRLLIIVISVYKILDFRFALVSNKDFIIFHHNDIKHTLYLMMIHVDTYVTNGTL